MPVLWSPINFLLNRFFEVLSRNIWLLLQELVSLTIKIQFLLSSKPSPKPEKFSRKVFGIHATKSWSDLNRITTSLNTRRNSAVPNLTAQHRAFLFLITVGCFGSPNLWKKRSHGRVFRYMLTIYLHFGVDSPLK